MLPNGFLVLHYNAVIMSAKASQITSLAIVYLTVYSRRRSKKTSKLRVAGLCGGNPPMTCEFPAQGASNVENVSIWWRHHEFSCTLCFQPHRQQSPTPWVHSRRRPGQLWASPSSSSLWCLYLPCFSTNGGNTTRRASTLFSATPIIIANICQPMISVWIVRWLAVLRVY